ncbi:twin-arginine translocation signal domain-containing protein [Sphingomonas sp. LY29]|uniref:twin-arginine translocation signal domain-containing protein n=1 Tax=Sphingomonas sp. LY29 TaxID=3095341 RepID=UPI003A7F5725
MVSRRDLLRAAAATGLTMVVYSLWASSRRVCFDSPCYLPENVIYFLFDEAWVIGLGVFPLAFLTMWAWRRGADKP